MDQNLTGLHFEEFQGFHNPLLNSLRQFVAERNLQAKET